MENESTEPKETSVQQLGILLKPNNLLRTLAAAAPGGGALLEIKTQLEGARIDHQIKSLREADIGLQAKLQELEKIQPQQALPVRDWPPTVGAYLQRITDITVIYDAPLDSPIERGEGLINFVSHGCFIGPGAILTCVKALEIAKEV